MPCAAAAEGGEVDLLSSYQYPGLATPHQSDQDNRI